ncbi:MAG: hypothetical protein A2X12_05995 [Bacteroidetes bacterium GWE2_29_8]|nr:MAG: hypothetical protein A2X12_05995 [Bacteroidetes bacterium GWE2_29_8]OFY20048.1 MAG: hypothetical protein A2X02_06695 [Bacteroidetes bacterium GWF2_29_10]
MIFSDFEKIADFENSYVTWQTIKQETYGRFAIDSIVEVFDKNNIKLETYYLLSSVFACNVFESNDVIKKPTYTFQAIFSHNMFKIYRNYAINDKLEDNYDIIEKIFKHIDYHIVLKNATKIKNFQDLKEGYLSYKKIVSMSTIKIKQYRYDIYFPVKHLNIDLNNFNFQIETGPILLPEKSKNTHIDNLLITYVALNNFNGIHFVNFVSTKIKKLNKIIRFFDNIDYYSTKNKLFYIE